MVYKFYAGSFIIVLSLYLFYLFYSSITPPLHVTDDTYIKPPPGVNQNLTIFIGILTTDWKIEIRECLRKMYKHNNDALARYLGVNKSPVTIRFILGLPTTEYRDKLDEESKMYGDIVILNITENMNQGKTFEYFNWFAKHRDDNYLIKLDDDSFIHLIHYYRDLQDLPRERAYYGIGLGFENGIYTFMAGCGYTLSRDLVIDIVGSDWARSNVGDNEDWRVGRWLCHVAKEKKYLVHYVGFSNFLPIRQNPIHDFDERFDLHFFRETILIHRIKSVEDMNAIKDVYSEYEEGLPMIRVTRNSTAEGLSTKRELYRGCWASLANEQTLQRTYKNWFYEAWGFQEGRWYGNYGSVYNIGKSRDGSVFVKIGTGR